MTQSPYRYTLSRTWDPALPRWLWVMLNPSTADAWKDDPTIRRCIRFTTDGGGGGLFVANLYAWRATVPEDLFMLPKESQRIGPINDSVIEQFARDAQETRGRIIAAWGAHPKAQHRAVEVLKILRQYRQVYCLGLTKAGFPRHPLYVPGAVQVVQMPENR